MLVLGPRQTEAEKRADGGAAQEHPVDPADVAADLRALIPIERAVAKATGQRNFAEARDILLGYKTRRKGMGNLQREKNGIWTMRFSVDGRRICRSTGTTDRVRAEQILQQTLAPLGLGKHRLPLMQVWRRYELSPSRRDNARATLDGKRRIWHFFSGWVETHHPYVTDLHHITHAIISEFLAEYRIDHTGGTYNSVVCVLREIFHTLSKEAGLLDDPWEGIRQRDDVDRHTRREFTPAEVRTIMDVACRKGDDWCRLFQLGLYTGLRLGDCCRLDWSEVFLDRGIIQVIPSKTKKHRHGRPVTIPIHPVLLKMLMETPRDKQSGPVTPFLCETYEGGRTHVIQHALKEIFHDAGIRTSVVVGGRKKAAPDATFHSLRHTFVSFAVNAGVPIEVVKSIVGHESVTMTRHYYHETLPQLQAAVASIPAVDLPNRITLDVSPEPEIVGDGVPLQALPEAQADPERDGHSGNGV